MSRVLVTGGSRGIGRSICLRHNGSEAMLGEKPDAWSAQDAGRLRPEE